MGKWIKSEDVENRDFMKEMQGEVSGYLLYIGWWGQLAMVGGYLIKDSVYSAI